MIGGVGIGALGEASAGAKLAFDALRTSANAVQSSAVSRHPMCMAVILAVKGYAGSQSDTNTGSH